MNDDPFAALAPARRQIAREALATAFGAAPVSAIQPVAGGASGASAFRVDVGGGRFLLRLEGTASPLRNPHQYLSMRLAAESGLAPALRHVDETERVAVMDFVDSRPLSAFPGGPPALLYALGDLLRRLQAVAGFPSFVGYPDIVARLFAHVRRTGLFAPGLLAAHVARLERVSAAYGAGLTQLTASHNDLIPANILFDGGRLWLIDWESAYANDPLVDVSTVLDTLAPVPALENAFFDGWLGRAPDETMRVRLEIARALTRLYYAGVFLSASAAAKVAAGDTDLSALDVAQFRAMVGDGRLRPGTPQTRHVLGKMFLASFLDGTAPPGFDSAV